MVKSASKVGMKHMISSPAWQRRVNEAAAARGTGMNMQVWHAKLLVESVQSNINMITKAKLNVHAGMPMLTNILHAAWEDN